MPCERLLVVVELYRATACDEDFERFEAAAFDRMRRHGGRLELRIRRAAAPEREAPDEIHLLSFPDGEALARYRGDVAESDLAAKRAEVIARTVVWTGYAAEAFGAGDGEPER